MPVPRTTGTTPRTTVPTRRPATPPRTVTPTSRVAARPPTAAELARYRQVADLPAQRDELAQRNWELAEIGADIKALCAAMESLAAYRRSQRRAALAARRRALQSKPMPPRPKKAATVTAAAKSKTTTTRTTTVRTPPAATRRTAVKPPARGLPISPTSPYAVAVRRQRANQLHARRTLVLAKGRAAIAAADRMNAKTARTAASGAKAGTAKTGVARTKTAAVAPARKVAPRRTGR